ncbi:MAG: hypothetical protein NTW64_06565 [Candidatus Omnitrophica bacterium]|nr:hypothetical protein [Candidatus Omnitrophota bacterium]
MMDFETIKNSVKYINLDSTRLDCANQFEAVVIKEEIDKLVSRLDSLFGPPAFPSKNRLSLQMRQTVDAFGGLMAGQTLYYSSQGNDVIFAMLWPWKDEEHTTVKIIKKII